jgi:biopolymer transport protein ExbD
VTYIYIGKPFGSEETRIQLNDKLADVDAVAPYVKREQASMLSEDNENMTVSIRADKGTQMGIINDVKQQLREAEAYKINYSAINK